MGDERQRGRIPWASNVGFIAAELAAVIVLMVTIFVQDRLPTEIYIILFTGIAAQDIAQACVSPKKQKIVFAVTGALIAACTLMYWVFWILELCGINI